MSKVYPYKIQVVEKYVSFYEEHENIVKEEFGIVVEDKAQNIKDKIENHYRKSYPQIYEDFTFRGKFPQNVDKGYLFNIEIGTVIS
jgi:hypothetical protein